MSWPQRWPVAPGERWLRLEVIRVEEPAFLALPLARMTVTERGVATLAALPYPAVPTVLIPLPAELPPMPPVQEGDLVKGASEHVYLIRNGRRRWIPSLGAFQRLGKSWEAVRQLDDQALWRIPQGLPME